VSNVEFLDGPFVLSAVEETRIWGMARRADRDVPIACF